MIEPRYQSDRVTLYCADCLEVLPQLEPGSVDAVVTDPPYGINHNPEKRKYWDGELHNRYSKIIGDNQSFDPLPFLGFRTVVLFGANWYSEKLPNGGWIVWDKTAGLYNTAPELAWCNKDGVKIIRVLHNGVINADSIYGNNEPRLHPTQKPVALIKEIVNHYCAAAATILDPFMGSGTTGVAAMQTGRKFIGIEIDEKYYAIAEKRIRAAESQLLLGI